MTWDNVFKQVCDRINKKGKLPDILDYYQSCFGIRDTEFPKDDPPEVYAKLDYGGSEGIYLDLIAKCETGPLWFGCIKTLDDSPEAMETMGMLLGSFIVEYDHYVYSLQ